jgi:nicotinamidase/pyrazinamidase
VKGTDPEVDSYSGFFDNDRRRATGLGEWLRAEGVTAVSVLGLATDYCVKFTALDAASLGLRVRLIADGCRAVELAAGDGARAIEAMRAAGVEIVDRAAVLAGR